MNYLPASVRLPFGYTVTIKVVAPSTLRRVAKAEVMGCWDESTRTIYVDKTMDEQQQRYTLTHELMHALADWQHAALGEGTD